MVVGRAAARQTGEDRGENQVILVFVLLIAAVAAIGLFAFPKTKETIMQQWKNDE